MIERLKVNENTIIPNDGMAREYDFNNIYLKIYPLEGGPPLIVSPRKPIDLSFAEGCEPGEKFIVEVIEMSLLDYEKLPEWDGF